jgi:hypothetical protein
MWNAPGSPSTWKEEHVSLLMFFFTLDDCRTSLGCETGEWLVPSE